MQPVLRPFKKSSWLSSHNHWAVDQSNRAQLCITLIVNRWLNRVRSSCSCTKVLAIVLLSFYVLFLYIKNNNQDNLCSYTKTLPDSCMQTTTGTSIHWHASGVCLPTLQEFLVGGRGDQVVGNIREVNACRQSLLVWNPPFVHKQVFWLPWFNMKHPVQLTLNFYLFLLCSQLFWCIQPTHINLLTSLAAWL